ncbi:MAG: hypothetical protein AAFQ65_02475 [Myxococcota bacterium]
MSSLVILMMLAAPAPGGDAEARSVLESFHFKERTEKHELPKRRRKLRAALRSGQRPSWLEPFLSPEEWELLVEARRIAKQKTLEDPWKPVRRRPVALEHHPKVWIHKDMSDYFIGAATSFLRADAFEASGSVEKPLQAWTLTDETLGRLIYYPYKDTSLDPISSEVTKFDYHELYKYDSDGRATHSANAERTRYPDGQVTWSYAVYAFERPDGDRVGLMRRTGIGNAGVLVTLYESLSGPWTTCREHQDAAATDTRSERLRVLEALGDHPAVRACFQSARRAGNIPAGEYAMEVLFTVCQDGAPVDFGIANRKALGLSESLQDCVAEAVSGLFPRGSRELIVRARPVTVAIE